MNRVRFPLFALAGIAVACSGSEDKIDIGDRDVTVIGASLTDYAGTWDGYAEAYEFSSGSDRVRITLDASGNGTVEFGDAAPLVPTDPEIGFPPVVWPLEMASISGLSAGAGGIPLKEGFEYAVSNPSLEERRFRFGVGMGEIIAPWCELQTSYELGPGYFSCSPPPASRPSIDGGICSVSETPGGATVPADCGWTERCYARQCTCDAVGCVANPELGTASFDATLENNGADLVGTLSFPAPLPGGSGTTTTRLTVRLTQSP